MFAAINQIPAHVLIIAVALTGILTYLIGWCIGQPRFSRKSVQSDNRGPNADNTYNTLVVSGREYFFTDEALEVAAERAVKYSSTATPTCDHEGNSCDEH